ncbi:WD40 repeat-like protein [Piedraia hortae CBS 480.64]|uniref:WD40 repeat-like protein n=1 Tax=Piedraia hortae CBS 480.64 TaxID=1314780 RepID=A0A6A7C4L2_9PEZI|nr:WD40 repeat-like protein [Piedraia hortae CBS 480.64]
MLTLMSSSPEIEEEEALQSFLGTKGFGARHCAVDIGAQIESARRQPLTAKCKDITRKTADSSDESSEDGDQDPVFPTSHCLALSSSHSRSITSLAVDGSGNRLVTASLDSTLGFNDFSSMTLSTLKAFKSVTPSILEPGAIGSKVATREAETARVELQPVLSASFDSSSQKLLVITPTSNAKVLSRDGVALAETVKGDVYLSDLRNTKGHISGITGGAWSARRASEFITAGTDGTLRVWDLMASLRKQSAIMLRPGRIAFEAVGWGDATAIYALSRDGELGHWDIRVPNRTQTKTKIAPDWVEGSGKSMSLCVGANARLLASQSAERILLFDTRQMAQPLKTISSPGGVASALSFSPDAMYLLHGSPTGELVILQSATLTEELRTKVYDSAMTSVLWDGKTNQILVGGGDGRISVLFDPKLSSNGALGVLSRAPKKVHVDESLDTVNLDLTAAAQGDEVEAPKKKRMSVKDPRRPDIPVQTPFGRFNPDEDYVRKNVPLAGLRDEDPREALLKFEGKEKVFTKAWNEDEGVKNKKRKLG